MNSQQINQYKRMLKDQHKSIEEIGAFTKNFFPKPIYRYRKFGMYWKDDLMDGKVHMSKATTLNDPFDCLVYIDEQKYNASIITDIKKIIPYQPENKLDQLNYDEATTDLQGLMRVASFTEVNDSILMWGHYSDSHRGFCIEYDFSRIESICQTYILPIVYSSKRYDATDDVLHYQKNNYINPFLFKSNIWEYEKEWRLLWPTEKYKAEKDYYFDLSKTISSVYLGLNMLQQEHGREMLNEILIWAKERKIKVFQMKAASIGYRLYPELIPY